MKRNREKINIIDNFDSTEYPFEEIWNLDEEEELIITHEKYFDYEVAEYHYDLECYQYCSHPLFENKPNECLPHGFNCYQEYNNYVDMKEESFDCFNSFCNDEEYWNEWFNHLQINNK